MIGLYKSLLRLNNLALVEMTDKREYGRFRCIEGLWYRHFIVIRNNPLFVVVSSTKAELQ